jgi:hypothetical protein
MCIIFYFSNIVSNKIMPKCSYFNKLYIDILLKVFIKGLNHFYVKWALKINSNKKTGKRKRERESKKNAKGRTGPDRPSPLSGRSSSSSSTYRLSTCTLQKPCCQSFLLFSSNLATIYVRL